MSIGNQSFTILGTKDFIVPATDRYGNTTRRYVLYYYAYVLLLVRILQSRGKCANQRSVGHGEIAAARVPQPLQAASHRKRSSRLLFSFGSDRRKAPHWLQIRSCPASSAPSRTYLRITRRVQYSTRTICTWRRTPLPRAKLRVHHVKAGRPAHLFQSRTPLGWQLE